MPRAYLGTAVKRSSLAFWVTRGSIPFFAPTTGLCASMLSGTPCTEAASRMTLQVGSVSSIRALRRPGNLQTAPRQTGFWRTLCHHVSLRPLQGGKSVWSASCKNLGHQFWGQDGPSALCRRTLRIKTGAVQLKSRKVCSSIRAQGETADQAQSEAIGPAVAVKEGGSDASKRRGATAAARGKRRSQKKGSTRRGREDILELPRHTGSIQIILGPMFSGKTTELLRRVTAHKAAGREVLLVKSSVDNRYAINEVVSHAGQRMKCLSVISLADIPGLVGHEAYKKLEVIGVDEAQFIQDLDLFATNEADFSGKTFILAGLDGDFLRRKFGGLVDLVPHADAVTKLRAQCRLCKGKAVFTFRKSSDLRTELVGGADLYMPVCRKHYLAGKSMVQSVGEVEAAGKTTK